MRQVLPELFEMRKVPSACTRTLVPDTAIGVTNWGARARATLRLAGAACATCAGIETREHASAAAIPMVSFREVFTGSPG
ncbi:MAG: hypothetical protein J0I14_00270 [Propionibacteriaceae bacterium]|nr:hypothetical protein [Propionibacteriaceae bacterium]